MSASKAKEHEVKADVLPLGEYWILDCRARRQLILIGHRRSSGAAWPALTYRVFGLQDLPLTSRCKAKVLVASYCSQPAGAASGQQQKSAESQS